MEFGISALITAFIPGNTFIARSLAPTWTLSKTVLTQGEYLQALVFYNRRAALASYSLGALEHVKRLIESKVGHCIESEGKVNIRYWDIVVIRTL